MKKQFTIFFLILISNLLTAQVSKTINLSTAGTLTTSLTATEKTTVINLTVTGTIDARDVKCMRDEMTALTSVDMGEVTIKAYSGSDGTAYSLDNQGLPQSVAYYNDEMPNGSFAGNSNLVSIILPKTITSIANTAFSYCRGLMNITFGNSLKTINGAAFSYCSALKNLSLPNSLSSIGSAAFILCTGLQNITIPNSVTSIGDMAFSSCSSLTKVIIGSGITSITKSVFENCTGLQVVRCLSNNPPVISSGCFSGLTSTLIIYVPVGTLNTYKTTLYWSSFKNIYEYIDAGFNDLNYNPNQFNIYPNPVSNELKIDFENGSTFEILNLQGKVVYTGNINDSKTVQMANFSEGIYLIRFKTGRTFEYKTIIKK
jgi:hypothetical protein